jgi:hypothetical protein
MGRLHLFIVVLTICLVTIAAGVRAQIQEHRFAPGTPPITVRPSALSQVVSELAGSPVNVQRARILWVVDPHAVVIESDSLFDPTWRDRGRVLVLLERNRSLSIHCRERFRGDRRRQRGWEVDGDLGQKIVRRFFDRIDMAQSYG